jgi:hypothetical protein
VHAPNAAHFLNRIAVSPYWCSPLVELTALAQVRSATTKKKHPSENQKVNVTESVFLAVFSISALPGRRDLRPSFQAIGPQSAIQLFGGPQFGP